MNRALDKRLRKLEAKIPPRVEEPPSADLNARLRELRAWHAAQAAGDTRGFDEWRAAQVAAGLLLPRGHDREGRGFLADRLAALKEAFEKAKASGRF